MSFPKILFLGSLGLFVVIGVTAVVKKAARQESVELATGTDGIPVSTSVVKPDVQKVVFVPAKASSEPMREGDDFPNVDRISQLFSTKDPKLPIVETITYASHVSWLKGRPAWIADYAAHYGTSRHFIARSLNGKPDYFSQKVSSGSKFNVFRKDRNFQFYLLVDLSLCKMGFYYVDLDTNERVLLKTYKVGPGKTTPVGKYTLGEKVAIYKPDQTEMLQAFGTRWIPFGTAKGFGIHGAPWELDRKTEQLAENREAVSTYSADGSIRLVHEDLEELFSIVITKPTIIEIVLHFKEANLPGVEVASPAR